MYLIFNSCNKPMLEYRIVWGIMLPILFFTIQMHCHVICQLLSSIQTSIFPSFPFLPHNFPSLWPSSFHQEAGIKKKTPTLAFMDLRMSFYWSETSIKDHDECEGKKKNRKKGTIALLIQQPDVHSSLLSCPSTSLSFTSKTRNQWAAIKLSKPLFHWLQSGLDS